MKNYPNNSKESVSIMRVLLKLCYYREWYADMTAAERISTIGDWVRQRIDIYTSIITETKKSVFS